MKKQKLIEWLYMTVGIIITALSFSFFLEPFNLVIGGVSGLAIILKDVIGINPSIIILVLNIVLLVLGLFLLGRDFFVKTVYGSLMFPLFVWFFSLIYKLVSFENYQTGNLTLVILFSSILMGIGIGLVVRYNGTTGGTEIPQKILFKYAHLPYSVSLYILDGIVVLIGSIYFKNFEIALYAIIFIALSGFIMDMIVFSGYNKRTVFIISEKKELISQAIIEKLNRTTTIIKSTGGFSKESKDILVCVLSTFEFYKLRSIISECDKQAFYFVFKANEVSGEGFTYEKWVWNNRHQKKQR